MASDRRLADKEMEEIKKWARENQVFLQRPDVKKEINNDALLAGSPEEMAKLRRLTKKKAKPRGGGGGSEDEPAECDQPLAKIKEFFKDIAGAGRAKHDLKMGFIFPQQYPALFQTPSRGILLFGPPGTGKTMIAKAAVNELTGFALFAPSPGAMKGKYVGETEKNIDRIFKCAESERPAGFHKSIIFFDEFENIASKRGGSGDVGGKASVTALLQAMDGIDSSKDVSVMAATNYPQDLDDAVLRRFTARVFVDLPTYEARLYLISRAIVKAYSPTLDKFTLERRGDTEFYWLGESGGMVDILANIKRYGRDDPEGKETKGWTGTTVEKLEPKSLFRSENCCDDFDRVITAADLFDLAKATGPKEGARGIMAMGGRTGDLEFSENAKSFFGYSGSDIDKLMNAIINQAADRALPHRKGVHVVLRASDNQYMYSAGGKVPKGTESVDGLPEKERGNYYTYDLTVCDLCVGLSKFGATIDNNAYVNLVYWQAGKTRPENLKFPSK